MGILDKFKKKDEDYDLPDLPEPPETSPPPGIDSNKPSSLDDPLTPPSLPKPEDNIPPVNAPMTQTPVEKMDEVTPVRGESDLKTEMEILSAKIDAIKSRLEAVNNKLDAVYRVVLGGARYQ